jgi:hypothetical protein
VEEGVFAVGVDERAVLDPLILFFEVGGEGGAVAAALSGLLDLLIDGRVIVG